MSISRKLLLSLLAIPPGIVWTAAGLLLFRQEYFFVTFISGGATLTVAAATATFLLINIPWLRKSRLRVGFAVAAAILTGWAAALIVMGILNLTPLCVGAESGDGPNDIGMCIVYILLYALVYTPLVLAGSAACAALAAAFSSASAAPSSGS